MNKELFNDIGDILGYNCYKWDLDIERKCDFCEETKKGCYNLEVISRSTPGNRRQVIMCNECFEIQWPPTHQIKREYLTHLPLKN